MLKTLARSVTETPFCFPDRTVKMACFSVALPNCHLILALANSPKCKVLLTRDRTAHIQLDGSSDTSLYVVSNEQIVETGAVSLMFPS